MGLSASTELFGDMGGHREPPLPVGGFLGRGVGGGRRDGGRDDGVGMASPWSDAVIFFLRRRSRGTITDLDNRSAPGDPG